jgi:CheY-like chemotaxis protein
VTRAGPEPQTSLRFLVADDDAAVLAVVARVLTGAGHEVVTVPSAEDAMAVFDAGRFDVVVSDVQMPGASGLDLLAWIEARPRPVPVILITGSAEAATEAVAFERDAAAFLAKPFGSEQLLDAAARARRSGR